MIARTFAAFRREGIGIVSRRAVRIARQAIGRQTLMVYRMPDHAPVFPQRRQLVEIEAGSVPSDPMPWDKAEIELRLGSGARFFALRDGSRLVSFLWASRRKAFYLDEIRRELTSEPEMVWLWDAVTPTEHRGRGYYPDLLWHASARLGQHDAIAFVRTDNLASVRGIVKAGFQPWVQITVSRWSAHIENRGTFDGRLRISS